MRAVLPSSGRLRNCASNTETAAWCRHLAAQFLRNCTMKKFSLQLWNRSNRVVVMVKITDKRNIINYSSNNNNSNNSNNITKGVGHHPATGAPLPAPAHRSNPKITGKFQIQST